MRKFTSWILLLSIYLSIIAPTHTQAQIIGRTRDNNMNTVPPGLTFHLSEGQEGAEKREKQQLPPTDPLSDSDASGLMKRLPAIKSDPDDTTDFAKRAGTLPPPKTGKMIPVKFPSDEGRGTPKVDPGTTLEVVRYSPEGEVSLAPDLNVTFSQPMVAVTSQEQAAQYAPVEFTPQVEGRWRWLGTKTLMFDTTKRFPMATKFTARIPAETKAVNGQILAKDVTWTFTTPPPKVEQMFPQNQVMRRDALMFISFDQEINPEAVLHTINVSSRGRRMPLRLATQEEIDGNGSISYYAKQAQPKRWLAFRAVNGDNSIENALPGDSTINVTVEKGTPSAEGPLTTTQAQSYQFTTYGPFTYTKAYCGWEQNKTCTPMHEWYLQFNNPIDASKFTKEMVKVEPAVENLNIYPSGNVLVFHGYKNGRTSYKITVDGSLLDTFGQKLGSPATATIRVGSADATLYSQGGYMTILDPAAKQSYSFYSINHQTVKVRLYAVQPTDWYQYQQYVRRINYDDDTQRPQIPGRLISDETVTVRNTPDELVETRIDLSKALNGGFGHVIIDVQPTVRRDKYDRTRIFTWAQATQIGLDAFVDNQELVGFATELKTGKPISGVDLAIYPNGQPITGSQAANTEAGVLEYAWNWLTSWGSDQAEKIEATETDGSAAEVTTVPEAQSNRTAADGILRLPLPATASDKGQNILIAKRGNDVAFLPENADYYWQSSGSWYKKGYSDSLRWFVFDDRGMYRPKEEVAVKGYIRKITGGKLGDVEGLGGEQQTYNWSARDPRNNEIAKGSVTLNAFGAFDLKFDIPDNVNLGYSWIDFTVPGSTTSSFRHTFQVQEFRRPEFEVTAKVESEAPHLVGGNAMLSVEAKYYAGGGLANAETNWTVTATPTNYTPPNRDDFTFGTWVPWWRIYDYGDGYYPGRYGGGTTQNFKGVTDASGKHLLKIDFESVNPPRPYTISASASVQDVNRQTWAGQTSLLVHPSTLYIGIRTPRTFVQKGEDITVESIVTDIDGKLVAGRDAEIKAVLKDWQFDKGTWKEVTIDEQTCTVKSTMSEPGAVATGSSKATGLSKCTFTAKQGGRYTITATVMDDRERFNQSEITVWVPGGKMPPKRSVEQEEVQIIPSKKDYQPGDVAELLVIAPFTPAEGVLTLRREGIVKTERFSMKDSSITLKVPVDAKYLPNIYAQVDLVGSAPRQNDKGEIDPKLSSRPAFASGNINLAISTASRKLTVVAEPRDKTLVPGGETKVDIEVKDNNGEPVANSEVAVVIVDESVLALSRYSIADPMSIFYTARDAGTADYHSRKDILLGNPADVNAPPPPPPAPAPQGAAADMAMSARATRPTVAAQAKVASEAENSFVVDGQEQSATPINPRQNFNALAVFAPSERTDSNGKITVNVKLPDNLTRYRITAVSVDQGKRFGKTESDITAKQPLMVRPSAPRFMNFGDRIDLPVVIQNQTDQDMTVDVGVRASNALLTGGDGSVPGAGTSDGPSSPPYEGGVSPSSATGWFSDSAAQRPPEGGTQNAVGKRVLVKANDRAEVRFPAAAVKAGTARFQIAVSSGKYSDAAEISLPVWTPATTEVFATYGTTDQNGTIIQPVQTPGDVFPQFGGLEVTTSSTQLQELTDAFISLYRYPFECTEQVSSRMISIAALKDVLTAFRAKDMPKPAEIGASFDKDIKILQSRQRDDGSFGLWSRERERYEYPFLTVHAAHALLLAKAKDYKVPQAMLDRTKPYLRDVEKHMDDQWYKSSPQVRWTISAYALYVRDLMGDKDAAKAKALLREATIEKMPFEALGWVLSVLANDPASHAECESIVRFLLNRTTETAATANFVTDYGDGAWLIMYSNRRADGVLLEALLNYGGATGGNAGSPPAGGGVDAALGGRGGGSRERASASPSQASSPTSTPPEGRTQNAGTQAAALDLVPKLVRGLLDHRVKGAWSNTQENVFILLALDRYFNTFEKVTPDFVTRVWLGSAYAGEQAFKGRSIDSELLNIPMSYLVDQGGTSNLLIDREGAGRLYYRIGMKYAPKNLKLDPADYGFTVLRTYEAIDNADDVMHNADGSWTFKSGARVRVRLTMVAQARRYHVALVDNLPAGLEILNPGLAVTEAIPPDQNPNTQVTTYGTRSYGHGWWWTRYWMEHQNFRDERAEAFASLLWEGVYNYSYVARATTPGEFIVPPAKAEEMYHPETFGRTGTDFVRVE